MNDLGPLARSRPEHVGLVVTAAATALLGFVPQLGGPGYDSALIAGVVLPATTAISVAVLVAEHRARPFAAVLRGIAFGLLVFVLALAVTFAHGLRLGICDAAEGLSLFVLGPGFGTALGGASGAIAGLCAGYIAQRRRRRLLAVVLALAGPLCGIAVSLLRFYTSPMVFAYDPYFGYFSGPLYDTVIASLWPFVTYRARTFITLLGLVAAASLVERTPDGRLALVPLRSRLPSAVAAAAALAASLTVTAFGSELGHFSTEASIERALGRKLVVARCDVVYSNTILRADAERLGRECNAHLAQIERFFEIRGPARVRVLLFANDVEKGRLMGAAHTYIAKPWRGEVYVQAAGFPHPVLGHELAHVVSSSFGVGPFRVAGLLGGLIPDPGRIEGVATAAAPDENDALTLDEWAAAMQRLRLLPPLTSLFQLSFFGQNAARAYTAAGAFIRFLKDQYGAAAVRRWYGGEPLTEVTGTDLASLDRRFRDALTAVPLSDAALSTARARFERPSFFERRCPRVIDRRLGEASQHFAVSDVEGAREAFSDVLSLDPHDSAARLGLAACKARAGDLNGAERAFAQLATAGDAAPWARLAALEARGDTLLRAGQTELARAAYQALAATLTDEDRLRTLDVKERATPGIARDAIVPLLIGDELGPSWDVAALELGKWAVLEPESGLADYLAGKNLFNRGRLHEAAAALDRALARALPEPRVTDEALRLRFVIACAVGDRDAQRTTAQKLEARPLSPARRNGFTRLAERCAMM